MKDSGMTKGTRAMAQRIVQAEESFIGLLMTMGSIDRAEAERVLTCYRKHKVVKMDAVGGRMSVKHGYFLDRETIRRAVTL